MFRTRHLAGFAVAGALASGGNAHPAVAAPGLARAWSAWKASAPLTIGQTASNRGPGFVRVTLPARIDPGPGGGYEDLRLVDDRGREVPYAIDPGAADVDSAAVPLPLFDSGFVPGAYSQTVADAGNGGTLHDALTISTSRGSFFVRANVQASDDRATWRDLASDTTLYRVEDRGDEGNQTVSFPPTRSRWLRVRVYDAHTAFPIERVEIARAIQRPAPLVEVEPASVKRSFTPRDGEQRLTVDFGLPNVAIQAVRIDGTHGYFSRGISVETGDDDRTWTAVGNDTIERFAEGGSQLGFAFNRTNARFARVTISNGNDAPLAGVRPVFLTRPVRLIFAGDPGRSYALAFSAEGAAAPVYDLAQRLARERWAATTEASVGAVAFDPALPSTDTRSFLERNPWVVNTAFLVVGALLALVAVRTIRGGVAGENGSA